MRFEFRPTVDQVVAAIDEAKAYWEAQDIEIFIFGASVDASIDADLFADEANAVAQAA